MTRTRGDIGRFSILWSCAMAILLVLVVRRLLVLDVASDTPEHWIEWLVRFAEAVVLLAALSIDVRRRYTRAALAVLMVASGTDPRS